MARKRLERELVDALTRAGVTLITVESCTGGGIADRITRVPGSSDVFFGAFVTYQERAKISLLGVSPGLLKREGAVSRPVAAAMAEAGFRRARDAGPVVAVSTTGIAGPGGGSARDPVGLCYIGIASDWSRGSARVLRVGPSRLHLSRGMQKRRFVEHALLELLREVARLEKRR